MSKISLKMFAIVFALISFGIFGIGVSNPVFVSNQEIPCCRLATGSCQNVCSQFSIAKLGTEAKARENATRYLRQFCSNGLMEFWACMNFTLINESSKKGTKKWPGTVTFHYTKKQDTRSPIRKLRLKYAINYIKNGRKAALREDIQYIHGNIEVSVGYSADSQQVAPHRCYNATVSSISEPQTDSQLTETKSFSELEKVLGVPVSVGGKFEMFAAEGKAIYVRSLQDNDNAISLNYYEYTTSNVAVQITSLGVEALTETGKGIYKDGKNLHFGLLCGDYFIDSFEQGALLTMGLMVKFSNALAKDEFYQRAGAKFGNMVMAMESIKRVSAEYKMVGSITIQAFQIGGDPSQLSKILNKDSTGNYYALTCSLMAMDNCTQTASGLLHYAANKFAEQFSFKKKTGIKPLGIAYSKYKPIEWINLIPPVSLVTQEVVQYRIELSKKLKENEYYQQKLYPFLNNGYPTKLEDAFIDKANAILSKANSNMHILMQPHEGAADCFNMPDECKTIKARIDSQHQNITISDLRFLANIKYTMGDRYATLYNTGSKRAGSWDSVSNNRGTSVELLNVTVTDKQCSYCVWVNRTNLSDSLFQQCFDGNVSSDGLKYIGNMCVLPLEGTAAQSNCSKFELLKLPSPFFFGPNEMVSNGPKSILIRLSIVYKM